MPLESLENDEINIHDLTLEQEKKPITESEAQFVRLKDSSFYAEKDGYWVDWVSNFNLNERKEQSFFRSYPQLTGVLCYHQYNPAKARAEFDNLKKTLFINENGTRWHEGMEKNADRSKSGNYHASSQLAGVLCEHLFNPERALEIYSGLKNSELYDKERQLWYNTLGQDDKILSKSLSVENQLLGILCEALVDPNQAKKLFGKLKSSRSYIEGKGMWDSMIEINITNRIEFMAEVQLLGVMCESLFDRENAKKVYSQLKASVFYDKDTKIWNRWMKEDGSLKKQNLFTADQLLGILCEQKFEEPTTDLQSPTPELPETRKY